MPAPPDLLAELRRPRLLMRAVAFALPHYQPGAKAAKPAAAKPAAAASGAEDCLLEQLLATEARLEACRRSGDSPYSAAAHITALVSLIAEARAQLSAG